MKKGELIICKDKAEVREVINILIKKNILREEYRYFNIMSKVDIRDNCFFIDDDNEVNRIQELHIKHPMGSYIDSYDRIKASDYLKRYTQSNIFSNLDKLDKLINQKEKGSILQKIRKKYGKE